MFVYKILIHQQAKGYDSLFGFGEDIITKSDKVVLLDREDKTAQAESLVFRKQKYGNDQQMISQKTMELYKEHNVHPAKGCLPLLIQLPILWALFGVLRKEGVVPDETFLWFSLISPDPFFVLPILNGIISFVQQKVMGTANNPQMKKMMYMFPIMMVFISYKMPGGLQLYWLVSSLSGVAQQYFVMNRGE